MSHYSIMNTSVTFSFPLTTTMYVNLHQVIKRLENQIYFFLFGSKYTKCPNLDSENVLKDHIVCALFILRMLNRQLNQLD
jgi:hypothetical protein